MSNGFMRGRDILLQYQPPDACPATMLLVPAEACEAREFRHLGGHDTH